MKYLASLTFLVLFFANQASSQDAIAYNNTFDNFKLTNKVETPAAPDFQHAYDQISKLLVANINYPIDMMTYGIEGRSIVSASINKKGLITEVVIIESLGFAFDREIKEVLRNAKVKTNFSKEETIVFPVLFSLSR